MDKHEYRALYSWCLHFDRAIVTENDVRTPNDYDRSLGIPKKLELLPRVGGYPSTFVALPTGAKPIFDFVCYETLAPKAKFDNMIFRIGYELEGMVLRQCIDCNTRQVFLQFEKM